ncbi:MAG: hypothetical protein J6D06_08630 [Clostridia bacterium]|nr:hypothetical protein [Clostridia bacterium]
MDFKNYFCPVCNNKFTESDDVVVCPECGTPHHRDCYFSNGGCFNSNKHNSDENISETYTDTEAKNKKLLPEITVEFNNNKENERKEFFGNSADFAPSQTPLIGGKHGYLFEIAVGKNQRYYIPRFMLMDKFKKGLNWNFFAFLCPLAWSLYRKMYKLSVIVLAMYVLILGSMGYFIMNDEGFIKANEVCMQENPEYYTDISAYLSGNGDYSLTPAQQQLIKETETLDIPRYVAVISWALPLVVRSLMGLFSTKLYYDKLRKNIEKAENKGLYGDELKNYLHRKYGTLPLIVVGLIGIIEVTSVYF